LSCAKVIYIKIIS